MADMSRRERLMKLLIDKTQQLGRKATLDDMKDDPMMPAPNDYAFYAGSFSVAADEAWAKVRQEMRKEGGVATEAGCAVVKRLKTAWPGSRAERRMEGVQMSVLSEEQLKFTEDDWLQWLLDYGNGELPKPLTLKSQKREIYFQILKVFGNWMQVEAVWKRKLETDEASMEVAEGQVAKEEAVVEELEPEEEVAVEEVAMDEGEPVMLRNRRRAWTSDECLGFLREVREKLGRLPTQKEINAMSVRQEGPSSVTLLKRLGKKDTWERLLGTDVSQGVADVAGDVVLPESEGQEIVPEEQAVEPKAQEDVARVSDEVREVLMTIHSAAMDVSVNGTRMKVYVNFGSTEEE